MRETLHIAVVGHTNAGKTSLLRTLTRRADFGEVSERPGTTRHVEAIDLRTEDAQGRPHAAVRFYDTPGLEDAVTLLAHVAQLPGATRPERIRAFLAGPEAHGVFEQEAKVLRQMLAVDAAFLVIDTREPVLPKYHAELELLGSCARPVMPVLNFVRDGASREAAWRALLSDAGLHAVVRFDAAAPFTGAERELFHDLGTLLPAHREALRDVAAHLAREAQARRQAACRVLAASLVEGAALRRRVPEALMQQPAQRDAQVAALRAQIHAHAQRAVDALLALHGFRAGDAAEAPLPALQGREGMDLFDPEALRQTGVRLGQGAAVGAAVGAAADLAVAGLSLGAGMALGGLIGGTLAQGWGPLGRRLQSRWQGLRELQVEDPALYLMADWQLRLLLALEQRGHGATARTDGSRAALPPEAARALVAALAAARPARSQPGWFPEGPDSAARMPAARERCVDEVAAHVQAAAQAAASAAPGAPSSPAAPSR
ncbi:GTPase/DUF3482 domain-containing protein [Xenophilus sp. Marseille-Q4582]|uniref:GTPase/DUF3482 domain-containing protein n=1 Tax=Xenophilus sp. Marseille-Q4582 TaxID=2866600 RepID=UPI001CE41B99|nr:GTPase/DUF3482 domain-containing protein [Xenophilus sp. Marseille-Q4582]